MKTQHKFVILIIFLMISWCTVVSAQVSADADPIPTLTQKNHKAKSFMFDYSMYDKYRIKVLNNQQVSIDNKIVEENIHIENNILVEILERGFSGFLVDYSIQTIEEGHLIDEENSVFHQNSTGTMKIPREYLAPYVRDIPQFPEYPLEEGDSWVAPGVDYFVFPNNSAYPIEVQVEYTYLGIKILPSSVYDKFNNKTAVRLINAPVIEARYSFDELIFESARIPEKIPRARFHMKIWWNEKDNRIEYYKESFDISTQIGNKPIINFKGTAEGIMIPVSKIHRELAESLKENLEDNLENVKVESNDEGIHINIENIGFKANSAILTNAEKEKLRYIAGYLSNFKGRRILVEGHTADFGTKEQQMELSIERAKAVVDALKNYNVDSSIDFLYRGKGATEPLDSNFTEEGRSRNRRVEITILEN